MSGTEYFSAWCNEESPFWKQIGMAMSMNSSGSDYQYILEELKLGNRLYLYRVIYTYGTVPPIWYLKGLEKAVDGEVRQGYTMSLKDILPASIPGIMRQALPEFKLRLIGPKENFSANQCGGWKLIGAAAPNYNHFRKDLYELWEWKGKDDMYKYKCRFKYSEMPEVWLLEGDKKAEDGEFRRAQYRNISNGFLRFKLNIGKEGFPGRGWNPWTNLWSDGYKGTAWDGSGNIEGVEMGSDWETVGRAGMYLSTGRPPYYNYVLQERRTGDGRYEYRIYNPDNVDFAGVKDSGPEYIRIKGNTKVRDMEVREAMPSSLSLELPGFYSLKTRDY